MELFITQFQDVALVNRWSQAESLLHLRGCLKNDAADCGREATVEDTYQSLRTRFGLTAKQARETLLTLRKKPKQSYHELGAEITRLVQTAYGDQGIQFRTQTMLETYSHAISHKQLRQHLLARPHRSIAEAVTISNEFNAYRGAKAYPSQSRHRSRR